MPVNPTNLPESDGGIVSFINGIENELDSQKSPQKSTSFASGGNQKLGDPVAYSTRLNNSWMNIFRITFLPGEKNTFAKFGPRFGSAGLPNGFTQSSFPELRNDGNYSWIFGISSDNVDGNPDADGTFVPMIFSTGPGTITAVRLM